MKILITGSNGFIGKNINEHFQNKFTEISAPKREELNLLDRDAVESYIKKNNFDVIVHCCVTLTSIEQNLEMYFNIERLSNSFGKLICIGSGAEFDGKNYIPKMSEDYFDKNIPSKSDIYGYSKYEIAKDILKKKRNIYNLRVFGIFGKYEDYRRRLISNNICKLLCGENITLNKNGCFDYMYVNDFSNIVENFIKVEPKHSTYNTCTGKVIEFLTLVKIINDIDGRELPIEIKQEGINPEYSGDNSRFVEEFGSIKLTDPKISIKELYNWYKLKSNLTFDDKLFDSWIKN
jgi:UDP-glucose 4-epimerase